jgi:hypothetical protein
LFKALPYFVFPLFFAVAAKTLISVINHAGFQVLTAACMKIAVFRDVAPYGMVKLLCVSEVLHYQADCHEISVNFYLTAQHSIQADGYLQLLISLILVTAVSSI